MRTEPTVFIVDDDEQVRRSLSFLIASAGLKAETFASAEELLAAYDPRWPGCILLDIRMDGMGGLELQSELQARGIRIPIIIISGFADVPSVVRAVKNGAVDVLEKPFQDEALLERVQAAIQRDLQSRQTGRAAHGSHRQPVKSTARSHANVADRQRHQGNCPRFGHQHQDAGKASCHRAFEDGRRERRGIDATGARAESSGFFERKCRSEMMRERTDTPWLKYGTCLVVVGLACLVRRAMDRPLGSFAPYATFYAAVLFSAWWGGLRPALFALLVGFVCGTFFFVQPRHTLVLEDRDAQVHAALYFFVSSAIALLGGAMHSAKNRAERLVQEAITRQKRLEDEIATREQAIADRKRVEQALREADRRKDDFLAMLGHELRNPLASVLYAVQALRKIEIQNPEAAELRQLIERASLHMTR